MRRRAANLAGSLVQAASGEERPMPPVAEGPPRPGRLVRITAPEWRGTEVYHTLYLPANWEKGKKYPVIVEYPGNLSGTVCTGRVEDCKLGYYESGGQGFVLMALPFINVREKANQLSWWGDVDATVEYCVVNVKRVCEEYGGDPSAVFLTGFSRGAIACGYIGLHDDTIAGLWVGLIPYAHFDGGSFTHDGAEQRLARVKGRPVLISYGAEDIEGKANSLAGAQLLKKLGEKPELLEIPGIGHSDLWIASASSQRAEVRAWLAEVLKQKRQ